MKIEKLPVNANQWVIREIQEKVNELIDYLQAQEQPQEVEKPKEVKGKKDKSEDL